MDQAYMVSEADLHSLYYKVSAQDHSVIIRSRTFQSFAVNYFKFPNVRYFIGYYGECCTVFYLAIWGNVGSQSVQGKDYITCFG